MRLICFGRFHLFALRHKPVASWHQLKQIYAVRALTEVLGHLQLNLRFAFADQVNLCVLSEVYWIERRNLSRLEQCLNLMILIQVFLTLVCQPFDS